MPVAADVPRDLVLRARVGDRAAFRRLVDALAKYAYNVAYRLVFNASDAEDVTQEIFLRLHRHLDKYDASQPFLPWFRTLATNVCLNWRRRQHRVASLDAMEADPAGTPPAPPQDPSAILQRALEALSAEYKMVLTHLYFDNLSVAEIARTMNVPEGTIKTWLYRAREELKQRLQAHAATLL